MNILNHSSLKKLLLLLVLYTCYPSFSQIYKHEFGTSTINKHPYEVAPDILNGNLSNSSWVNTSGAWSNAGGATGQGIRMFPAPGSSSMTLTFDVATGYAANITSFSFWSRRTGSGPKNWQLSIGGTVVGSGLVSPTGEPTGNTNVNVPTNGLTGTVTVLLSLTNGTGGNIIIDDFTLNGTVGSNCSGAVISSIFPQTGPANTTVTLTGSGFNATSSVTVDGVPATFNVVSATTLSVVMPSATTDGIITVQTTNGCPTAADKAFTILEPACGNQEVYISEVYDANAGSPGAIELYNPTAQTIVFNGQYTLERYTDKNSNDNPSILVLPNSIAPFSTYLINSGPAPCGITPIASIGAGINEDDELRLLKSGQLIDLLQVPSFVGKGYTLIRKPDAVAPKPTYSQSDWINEDNEYCSNLGIHNATTPSNPIPVVTQPQNANACEGSSATFTTAVTGTGYTYQWKMLNTAGNWVDVTNNGTYTGANTGTLTVNNVTTAMDNTQFYCLIKSSTCTIYTNAVMLTIGASLPAPTGNVTNEGCTTPGQVTITAPTGSGYTYSLDGGTFVNTVTFSVAAGNHNIVAKNAAGCTSQPYNFTVLPAPNAPAQPITTVTQPTCNAPDGSIVITPPAGTGFTYSLNNAPFVSDTTFSQLPAGNYTIVVKNSDGCTTTNPVIVINPAPTPPPAPKLNVVQTSCTLTTGTITVTSPTGSGYTYSINNGPFDTKTSFGSLTPGDYTVTVSFNGCTTDSNLVTINTPGSPAAPEVSVIQPSCTVQGRITITNPAQGTGYTYSIGGNYTPIANYDNLLPGTYQVTVRRNGCTSPPTEVVLQDFTAPSCIENPELDYATTPSTDANLAALGTWYTSHGTPAASPGSVYMWSYAGSGAGIYTCYNFEAGKQYKVCINLENENAPGTLGYTNPDAKLNIEASKGTFTPRPNPAGNQIIASWHMTDQAPADYTYTFTATDNYNRIWLYPHMQQNAPSGLEQYMVRIYSVKVEEVQNVTPTATLAGNTITVSNTPANGHWEWAPASLVVSQNANGTEITVGGDCSVNNITGTFVADCAMCTQYAPLTIAIPNVGLPQPTFTTTDPDCATPKGSINVTTPLGTNYTYSIGTAAGFQVNPVFTDVDPGTYTLTVKDNNGCTGTASVTINPATALPAPTLTLTQPDCNNAFGTITVNTPTGIGYEYQLDSSAFLPDTLFENVPSGTHTVTVRNANGCTAVSAQITINPAPTTPAAPVYTLTQPTCTTATGTISITPPAGTGFTYSDGVHPYQASPDFLTVTPGTYSLTIKNSDGCISPAVTVTIDAAPASPATPQLSITQPDCTTATGIITVITPVDTTLQYRLNAEPYQSSPVFNMVPPGNHTVTVINTEGCTAMSASVTINPAPTIPAAPVYTITQPNCNVQTGIVSITPPTGTGFTYSNGVTAYQSDPVFSGLTPGNTYSFTIKSAAGCISPAVTVTIDAAPAVPAVPQLTLTQPDCNNATGGITVTATTDPSLQYRLDNGPYQSTLEFGSVQPGTHTVTVINTVGCTATSTPVIINAAPVTPTVPQYTVLQPTCTVQTGSISITPQAGTGYTYSDGVHPYQASPNFTGLTAGTYTLTIRSAGGCISPSVTVTIDAAPPVPATPLLSLIQPDCTTPTGTITVTTPTGGTLQYRLDGGSYQSTPTFTMVTPGNHTVTVINTNGCTATSAPVVILAAPGTPAVPDLAITQPTCNTPTGTITVTAPKGTGLQYSINGEPFQASPYFTGRIPGTYSITVRNANGCISAPATAVIDAAPTTPAAPVVTLTQPDCFTATGTITVDTPTGTGLEYRLDNGTFQVSPVFTTVQPGLHYVYVRNAAGCISTATSVIITRPPLQPTEPVLQVTQPNCNVQAGQINVSSPIGVGYTYSINGSPFGTSRIFTNLIAGSYTITVRNDVGCEAISQTVTINIPPMAAPSPGTISGNNAVCIGDTVQLTASVSGGTWSVSNPGYATIDATGLVTPLRPGTARIFYTVGTECTATVQHNVVINALPNPELDDMFLCLDSNGQPVAKMLSAGLNNTDYTFSWTKDNAPLTDTTNAILVSEPGEYTVIATSVTTGCASITSATVGISSIATATAEVGMDFSRNQIITVTVTGGSGDYQYSLDGGAFQDENIFGGVTAGEHIVLVQDKNGCGTIQLFVFALDYPRYFTPNADGTHETWNIRGLAGQRDAMIFIYDRYGKLITSVSPYSGRGWDGTYNGRPLPATDYWFTVQYTSSSGQRREFKSHFSLLR